MKIPFTVFSVEQTRVPTEATLAGGEKVTVAANAVAVQLVHERHGTLRLTLMGNEAVEARDWAPGSTVHLTIEA